MRFTMTQGRTLPYKGGLECDVFSSWRKVLCYTSRAGVCKYAKRKYNRRVRRLAKEATWLAAKAHSPICH